MWLCSLQAAKFERVLRATTAEALKLHDPDAERLFAYLLGSYCRGKAETGAPGWDQRLPAPPPDCCSRGFQRLSYDFATSVLAGDIDLVIIVPEVRQDKSASEVHLAVRLKLLEKVTELSSCFEAAGQFANVPIVNLVSSSAFAQLAARKVASLGDLLHPCRASWQTR